MESADGKPKMVIFTGGAYRIRKGLCAPQFEASGMRSGKKEWSLVFKTGIVYKVSDKVFEYLKAIRGFYEVKGMAKEIVDFPKKSEKNETKTEKEVEKAGYKTTKETLS